MRSPIIFFIEDDADDTFILQQAIDDLPYEVDITFLKNGYEALRYFSSGDHVFPDLLFMDLNMPKLDGLECLRRLKDDQRLADLPVIMLSSSSNQRQILQCYENGAAVYLIKPASVETLGKMLHLLIKHIGPSFAEGIAALKRQYPAYVKDRLTYGLSSNQVYR